MADLCRDLENIYKTSVAREKFQCNQPIKQATFVFLGDLLLIGIFMSFTLNLYSRRYDFVLQRGPTCIPQKRSTAHVLLESICPHWKRDMSSFACSASPTQPYALNLKTDSGDCCRSPIPGAQDEFRTQHQARS